MRKNIIYAVITLVVCIGSSSFKQVCNDNDVEASYKEKLPVKNMPGKSATGTKSFTSLQSSGDISRE